MRAMRIGLSMFQLTSFKSSCASPQAVKRNRADFCMNPGRTEKSPPALLNPFIVVPQRIALGGFPRRFCSLWRYKLILMVILNLLFWVPYSLLARNAFFPIVSIPETFFDHWIPFQPDWTFVYISEYLLTFFIPWLITRPEELRRYALGML